MHVNASKCRLECILLYQRENADRYRVHLAYRQIAKITWTSFIINYNIAKLFCTIFNKHIIIQKYFHTSSQIYFIINNYYIFLIFTTISELPHKNTTRFSNKLQFTKPQKI